MGELQPFTNPLELGIDSQGRILCKIVNLPFYFFPFKNPGLSGNFANHLNQSVNILMGIPDAKAHPGNTREP